MTTEEHILEITEDQGLHNLGVEDLHVCTLLYVLHSLCMLGFHFIKSEFQSVDCRLLYK